MKSLIELRKEIEAFIEQSRPPVILNGTSHFVFRPHGLAIVKSGELRIGDIRMIIVDNIELVKGLTLDNWNTLLRKYQTLDAVKNWSGSGN